MNFQFQSMGLNQWGQLWPPITLGLLASKKVLVEGYPPHGAWGISEEGYLHIDFNYRGDESRTVQHLFDKVPKSTAWATIRCKPEWAAMLVPAVPQGCGFVKGCVPYVIRPIGWMTNSHTTRRIRVPRVTPGNGSKNGAVCSVSNLGPSLVNREWGRFPAPILRPTCGNRKCGRFPAPSLRPSRVKPNSCASHMRASKNMAFSGASFLGSARTTVCPLV
jgi:hypothetical protein